MHDSSFSRRDLLTTAIAGAIGTSALVGASDAIAQPFELPTTSRELWQWVGTQPVADARDAWLDTASAGATLRSSMASEYRAREIQSGELPSFASGARWPIESARLATRFAAFAGC